MTNPRRSHFHVFFILLALCIMALIVSACGGTTAEAPAITIPTPVPRVTFALLGNSEPPPAATETMAPTTAPTNTEVPTTAPTHTTVPVVAASATPEPAVVSDTQTISDTAAPSDTAPISETNGLSTTNAISQTASIIETAAITASSAVTAATVPTETVRVFFRQPSNNATIPLTSTVIMSATGLAIAPAGDVVQGTGHFHVLVDTDFIEPGQVIPKDAQHLHFGDGATVAEIGLPAGSHTLRLQFADGAHTALAGDQYRDEITVSVVEGAPEQAVRFVLPRAGAVTPPQVDVTMAATGLIIEPAGVVAAGAGHFHILVDSDFVEPGTVIPKDEQHLHFGSGQLTTTLELAPGEHTLRLQLADGAHSALDGDQYRDEISITVAAGAPARQVRFAEPLNGADAPSPVMVRMTSAGLIVEPAGLVLRAEDASQPGGHMHILVDTDFIAPGEVIPKDAQHLHFGGGQLQTELELTPGVHILRLQMANGAHIALAGEQYRDEISITVK